MSLPRLAVLVPALGGCLLLAVGEFSTLWEIKIITVVHSTRSVGANHLYAQLVIAVAAAAMAYGAAVGGSLPAALGLLALAILSVVIVLAFDLPTIDQEGPINRAYDQAETRPRSGFYLESLGAALLLLGAVGALLLRPARQ